MTRGAKITYLGALLIGLLIGVIAGYKNARSRLDLLDDTRRVTQPHSLSEFSRAQFAHADVAHARAALLAYANVLEELEKLKTEKQLSLELQNTYSGLAILDDEANNPEESRLYMATARHWSIDGGGTHTDSEIKAAVKAAYELWEEVATASTESEPLAQIDWATFGPKRSGGAQNDMVLDPNFTWTDSSGSTRDKAQVIRAFHSEKTLPLEAGRANARATISAHVYGQVGIIRENSGNEYVLRVWVKRPAGWQALVYQAVAIGAPPTFEQGSAACKNPCETVPFEPRTADEREVVHAYQAVERAVTAHNSREWGVHIADEFFAVTSNSDRPLDKATRMAGLDNQKVAGIAPFPLVSARMFEFGDAMVMISRQQPEHGLPLHVTRIWFKRNGTWLEAYSYQTTIQPASTPH